MIQFIRKYTFGLVAIVFACTFFCLDLSIRDFDFSNILIALASVVATILALVFTLSLIPIQNAASMWSFSILRIYKEDKINYQVFLLLGLSILVLVLLAIFEKKFDDNCLLLLLILFLGVMLDSLRFYYGHVVSLMDPQSILEKIKKQSFKTIDVMDDMAKTIAKNQYFLQGKDNKENLNALEAKAYKMISSYPQAIRYWFNDLAEIYQKSVGRNDLMVAKATLAFMVEILDHFLQKRKNNISYHTVFTGLFPVKEADVSRDMVTPFCEILKDLFVISCRNSTENIALEVIAAYKAMAASLAKVDMQLVKTPISYAKECSKYAQSIDSIEIPFQSTQIIFDIHQNIQEQNILHEVDHYIIDFLEDVIKYLYTKNHPELAEYSLKYLMQLNRFDDDFKERFKKILEVVYRLVPFALLMEASKSKLSVYTPLSEVYSLICFASMGNIYEYAVVQKDINLLVDMLDTSWRHLRSIAETHELQNSFMLHEINSTIEHISDINVRIFRDSSFDTTQLQDKFKWLLSFYWVVYDNKQTLNEYYLRQCIETLRKIAIDYMKIDFEAISLEALGHIMVIMNVVNNVSDNEYLKRDMIEEIEKVKAFAKQSRPFDTIVKKCEEGSGF